MAERCLAVRTHGRLLILRQNDHEPTEDDWNIFLEEIREHRSKLASMRAMVFSDGGGPTVEQRRQLAAAMGGQQIQTAVICDKGLIRFVVSTIGLFNKGIRTYSWREVTDAYRWLGLNTEERQTVEESVASLSIVVQSRRHAWSQAPSHPPDEP